MAGFGGLFAAATAEPATEAPQRKTAPIESSDSLLDILMGLDSVINKQRHRQPSGGTDVMPEPPPLQADRAGPPPLQMDLPSPPPLQPERADPPPLQADPPLQAEPALQADWQAEIQQRHSTSQQALKVQALLREAGWQGPGRPEQQVSEPELGVGPGVGPGAVGQEEAEVTLEQEAGEEARCRQARQYDVQRGEVLGRAEKHHCSLVHKTADKPGTARLTLHGYGYNNYVNGT